MTHISTAHDSLTQASSDAQKDLPVDTDSPQLNSESDRNALEQESQPPAESSDSDWTSSPEPVSPNEDRLPVTRGDEEP